MTELSEAMDDAQSRYRALRTKLTRQLAELDRREERFLDLAADESMPRSKIRERLTAIAMERQRVSESLNQTDGSLRTGEQILTGYLDLLHDPGGIYAHSQADVRRLLNEAHFEALYLDDEGVQEDIKTEIAQEVADAVRSYERMTSQAQKGSRPSARPLKDPQSSHSRPSLRTRVRMRPLWWS